MNRKASLAAAAALLSAGMAQATCYSVYKTDGTLVHESSTTPVNLSLPIGDTVPAKFGPGTSMTVSDHGVFCKERRGDGAPAKSEEVAVRQLAGTGREPVSRTAR